MDDRWLTVRKTDIGTPEITITTEKIVIKSYKMEIEYQDHFDKIPNFACTF